MPASGSQQERYAWCPASSRRSASASSLPVECARRFDVVVSLQSRSDEQVSKLLLRLAQLGLEEPMGGCPGHEDACDTFDDDLPAPVGPTIATVCPGSTARERSVMRGCSRR